MPENDVLERLEANLQEIVTDTKARIAALETRETPEGLSEEQTRTLIEQVITSAASDPDSEFYRKLRFAGQGAPELIGSKFARWNMTAGDIEFLYDLQTSLAGQRKVGGGTHPGPSEELTRAFKAISDAVYMDEAEVRRIDMQALDGVFPRIRKNGRRVDEAGYQRAVRAAMDSAESGYGSQLIGAQYVGQLWDAARPLQRIFPLFNSFEMTAPTTYLPVEADIPEMLFVAENTADNSSEYGAVNTGSNRVSVTAKKFVLHQIWSGEMEEDSIIPFLPFLQRQAALSLAYYSDSLLLNGDTTNASTGNINLDDADPADTKHYLAFDGLRHAGLVDNTANSKDLARAIQLNDFFVARSRMAQDSYAPMHWGVPTDAADLVHICDMSTYFGLLNLDEFVTVDKYGPGATALTGEVGRVGGHPLIATQVMSLTEADGKLSTTGSNNVKGQVATVNRRGSVIGWRRHVKLETERLPARDQTRLVYSLRLGFGQFSPTGARSAIEHCDVIYDITV